MFSSLRVMSRAQGALKPTFSPAFRAMSTGNYEYILVEKRDKVGLITLNRPKALNALCVGLINEVIDAAKGFDADDSVGAVVLTGSTKAFAAGADIVEMADKSYMQVYKEDMFAQFSDIASTQKPLIAAVAGYALGGGCELAMTCDIIYAGDNAKFGQPEITLGTIPGAGGTQRLIRAVGKSKAMEMCLRGNFIDAQQAERDGLVARVYPAEELLDEALAAANQIASFSQPVTRLCKEAVNASYELTLAEGVRFERRLFHSTFATNDQKEGMGAFRDKRKPTFTNN